MKWMLVVVALGGCRATSMKLGETGDTSAATDGTDGTDGTDATTDAPASPWAGAYVSSLSYTADGNYGTQDFCDGYGGIAIADDGTVSGEGKCSGWGGSDIQLTITGSVDDKGAFTGSVDQTLSDGTDDPEDATGAVSVLGVTIDWSGTMSSRWGDFTYAGELAP